MAFDDLVKARYIALETFRKSGEGVITPVWQVPENGKMYVWTPASSWKVKRIRNDSRVKVCKSDSRGTPQSDWVEAQAVILDSPAEDKKQRQRMSSKYSWQFWFFNMLYKFKRSAAAVIEIRLPAS